LWGVLTGGANVRYMTGCMVGLGREQEATVVDAYEIGARLY